MRKEQAVTIVSIAAISLLIGTALNVAVMARPKKDSRPRIMTATGYPEWTTLESGLLIDLASVSNVMVSEGAAAFAVASVNLRCTEVAYAPMYLRLRINDTYGDELYQGFTHVFPPGTTERELVEFHHVWTDLSEGTYTFALQCRVNAWRVLHVRQARLTLIIT